MTSMTTFNDDWYNSLNKSLLTPPNWVFGIVWTVLYVMMTVSIFLIWQSCKGLCFPMIVFAAQLVLNLLWTTVFFKRRQIGLALLMIVIMIVLVGYTIYLFYPINKIAAQLLIPYFVWLCFAAYLNWYIYKFNDTRIY